jgi:hypothetical protein
MRRMHNTHTSIFESQCCDKLFRCRLSHAKSAATEWVAWPVNFAIAVVGPGVTALWLSHTHEVNQPQAFIFTTGAVVMLKLWMFAVRQWDLRYALEMLTSLLRARECLAALSSCRLRTGPRRALLTWVMYVYAVMANSARTGLCGMAGI